MTDLQELLLGSANRVEMVYFNEKGEYQLYDHPDYTHSVKTREEILNESNEVIPEASTKTSGKTKNK